MPSLSGVLAALDEVGLTQAKIDAAVASVPEIRTAVIMRARDVEAYWKSIAPVSTRPAHPIGENGYIDEPGDYRDSIHTVYETKPSGYFVATVRTFDPKARWLEYGSIHNPEYGFAQRVVDYFGGGSIDGDRGFAGVIA